MSSHLFSSSLRILIQNALPGETSLFGGCPELRYTYLPAGHAKALQPDSMLVVGIRGAGKSFWFSALQDEDHRSLIDKKLPKAGIRKDTMMSQGFGEKSSPEDYPRKDVLVMLLEDFDARQIWRTIVLMQLVRPGKKTTALSDQKDWKDRVGWVQAHPEEVERLFFEIDKDLDQISVYHVVLFDALDRTADDWNTMFRLVKGLLQALLEFRSFRRIRLKAFVRPDHLEDASVEAFPDSSKVLTSMVELNWPRNELYGLLWQYLANEPDKGHLFREGCEKGFGIEWMQQETVWMVPEKLRINEILQRDLFHKITGPWMGRDHRRGFPYTWLPNHLGDGRRQVSPRSFLAALRQAAFDSSKADYAFPLHYESIKHGVQEASQIRVREMQEDYPWVEVLMKPLAGVTVPCQFEEIRQRWKDALSLEKLEDNQSAPVKLPPSHLDEGPDGVRRDLEILGVFERMNDGRVNLPDVYRVGYGMGRRGGVKAVAKG